MRNLRPESVARSADPAHLGSYRRRRDKLGDRKPQARVWKLRHAIANVQESQSRQGEIVASTAIPHRRIDYTIARILNSIVPRGAFTFTVSPTRAFISASPIGLFTETGSTSLFGSGVC